MVDKLGTTQRDVYQFIIRYWKHEGFAPTVREIGDEFGIVPSNVHHHLKHLESKGFIRRRGNLARSLEVVDRDALRDDARDNGLVRLPIRGLIAAGQPIEALDDRDDFYETSSALAGSADAYALRVRGTSMIDEHICDGDLVIIQPQTTARNGEIVVALLADNGVTLKKFYHEGKHIRLQPANATMAPIIIPADGDIALQGTVRAVVRQMAF
jgi:repressor LexA